MILLIMMKNNWILKVRRNTSLFAWKFFPFSEILNTITWILNGVWQPTSKVSYYQTPFCYALNYFIPSFSVLFAVYYLFLIHKNILWIFVFLKIFIHIQVIFIFNGFMTIFISLKSTYLMIWDCHASVMAIINVPLLMSMYFYRQQSSFDVLR